MTEPNTAPMMAEVERPDAGEEKGPNQEGGDGADGGTEAAGGGGRRPDWPACRTRFRSGQVRSDWGKGGKGGMGGLKSM